VHGKESLKRNAKGVNHDEAIKNGESYTNLLKTVGPSGLTVEGSSPSRRDQSNDLRESKGTQSETDAKEGGGMNSYCEKDYQEALRLLDFESLGLQSETVRFVTEATREMVADKGLEWVKKNILPIQNDAGHLDTLM